MKRLLVFAVILILGFAGYSYVFSVTVRYRLTLEADVDGERKFGSSVVEVTYSNIDLAENETQISVALSTSTAIPALKNIPGAIGALLRMTAKEYQLDAVIVDMSPSVGALNQCFLMGSDYFIVPTSPDYYCNQAISSLSRVLPRWHAAVQPFRDTSLLYPFPSAPPKFSGIISQRYRPRSGSPAQSFQQWIDIIKQTVLTEFVPAMTTNQMSVSVADFNAGSPGDTPFNLINIADFNSLIAQSQKFNVPVFAPRTIRLSRRV